MSIKAWDIETVPNKEMIEFLEPIEAPATYKKPEVIAAYIEEGRKKQIEKMGLSPLTGRVASTSICSADKKYFKVLPEITDAAEIELVSHILESFALGVSQETNLFVTWNGFSFDFPFVYKRAKLLKISLPSGCPPLTYWIKKYSFSPHCDLEMMYCNWQTQKDTSLELIGNHYLGRGKTKRDYSTYIELIESGQGELIGLDNLCDTQLTLDLYNEFNNFLF
jgi:DNA polymerase elongation subunit (family B)